MPDIQALLRYIEKRRVQEGDASGYSFVRGISPTIRDTFFALACLKMTKADSPDAQIVHFLSQYKSFNFNGAYYAMKCLRLAGARVQLQGNALHWSYDEEEQNKPYTIPSTPLIRYFKYELYGMYASSIFSSSLSAVLKHIELDSSRILGGLVNSTLALLDMGSRQDLMSTYMALEILQAMADRGQPVALPSSYMEKVSGFLKSCVTRKGYVGSPTSNSVTLESSYAGHRIARFLKIPDPKGINFFIDSLQNENGGFRASQFGGISTLESCYLATSILYDLSSEEYGRREC